MLRWLTFMCLFVGPSYHMITYAKVNGGFTALYRELAAHSLTFSFIQLWIFFIVMVGPYLFIAFSILSSKSTVSDAITFVGGAGMVAFTFVLFAEDPNSPSYNWGVTLLPVFLFPAAIGTLVLSIIVDTKSRN